MHNPLPSPAPRPPAYSWCLLIALAGLGVLLTMFSTVWGAGATPDSATYVSAARNLQTGHGLRVQSDIHQSQQYYTSGQFGSLPVATDADTPPGVISRPLTQYPPLFSLLLAVPGVWGVDPLSSARWLNSLLFALNILLVGGAILRYSRGPVWPAVVGALLVLTQPDLLTIHAMAWSEAAFILFALVGCLALAAYLDGGQRRTLLLAAGAVGAASLTRYVGVVLILTGGVGLLVLNSRPIRRRMGDLLLFAAIAGVPLVAWLLRNAALGGSFANREAVYHPLMWPGFRQALLTVAGWVAPFAGAHPLRIGGGLLALLALGVAGSLVALGRTAAGRRSHAPLLRFSLVLLLFMGLYGLFLIFTISLYDAATPLDGRILSPVFVAGLVLVLIHLQQAISRGRVARWMGLLCLGLAVLPIGGYLVQSMPQVSSAHRSGLNYTGREWRQSDTIRRVAGLPPAALIYSNAPDAIYLLTGRSANLLPPHANIYTQRANAYYSKQMALIRAQATQQPVFLVYFRTVYRMYLPVEAELQQAFLLGAAQPGSDGVIYPLLAAASVGPVP
ncbi:MAG: hypothetical protein M3Z04_01840 [Chloroflexota bacterium]|nr:hypothetical protein [Chloroflexota bacterium]